MCRYQKKPVVVEAWVWLGEWPLDSPPTWLSEAVACGKVRFRANERGRPRLVVETPNGDEEACLHDYVIQHANGDLYPYQWNIFEEDYEPVLDEEGN